ncbi:predicted protein [Brucella melitensis bv. 3 str. Ether]|nr:predicted protein [Brucella melitensis bv. 3 str. Ether]
MPSFCGRNGEPAGMKHASFRAALIALVLAALGAVILLGFPKYWVFLITAVFIVGIAL